MSEPRTAKGSIEIYPPVRVLPEANDSVDNEPLIKHINHLRKQFSVNNKLLLVQIPQFNLQYFNPSAAKKGGYYAYPPTGLQYLAAALENRDIEVKILDLNFELLARVNTDENFLVKDWLTILDEYLHSFQASIIGVSCMFDIGIKALLEILGHLKNRQDCITLAGGIVPTYDWQKLLEQGLCHFVLTGESENKINFLLDHFLDDETKSIPTPGIHFRHKDKFNCSRGPHDEVDPKGNLISTYDLIPLEKYSLFGSLNPYSRMGGISRPFAAIILNRGCRAACTFCAVRDFNGKGVRSRSVKETLEEVIYLNSERDIKHFEFLDDDLLRYKNQIRELLQGIIDNKLEITWSANNGLIANSLDRELLELFRDTNCTGFRIGIESGNEEMLAAVRKPATLPSLRKSSTLLQGYPELFVTGNTILGFVNETFSQMLDTFWFSIEMDLDWNSYTICQIIRGASAFENFTEYFAEQMATKGENVSNFIPSRDSTRGEIRSVNGVLSGLEIFKLPLDSMPSKDQMKEIWFTYNMLGNFIFNKNLRPRKRPEKFISWVSMTQVAYPHNPYMCLFLALAHRLAGNERACKKQYDGIRANLENSKYWSGRFDQFDLSVFVENFPKTSDEVSKRLDSLRASVVEKIKITAPDNVVRYL